MVGGHATVGRLSNNVFWTFQAIIKVFEKSRWTVTRQWSEVTRLSADCQAHICMYIIINETERERDRERGRERERERERERPNTKIRQKKNTPTIFPFVDSGPISFGFSRESPAGMWYYVAYVYNGEFVSLIGNQRVGIFPPKSKILFHLLLASKRCRKFQDWSIPVGGITWSIFKKGICFPHRESASWNFPTKIKNSLLPKNIFHLISNNPGLIFSARRS